jgi:hypothetical protein
MGHIRPNQNHVIPVHRLDRIPHKPNPARSAHHGKFHLRVIMPLVSIAPPWLLPAINLQQLNVFGILAPPEETKRLIAPKTDILPRK